ncbi:hypothetical protein B4113_2745 [Geobacillus sp. B4113_201601]|nr:hypothetical protein B4113_2745 [Geobacillus sp. B4113_201601]
MKAFLHAFIFAFGPILRQRAFFVSRVCFEGLFGRLDGSGEGCGG